MKFIKIFVATMLLSLCGLAVSASVGFINFLGGDQVNGEQFTVVAMGEGYAPDRQLRIEVIVTDLVSGEKTTDIMTVTTN